MELSVIQRRVANQRRNHDPMRPKRKKILSWDEHAIEEHDQLRGTRMKIEEPNTPYTHYDHTKDDGDEVSLRSHSPSEHMKDSSKLCWETLEKKLETVAANRQRSSSFGSISSKEEETKSDFKKIRAHHYNEMEMLRKFRREHPEDDDDDEDEE